MRQAWLCSCATPLPDLDHITAIRVEPLPHLGSRLAVPSALAKDPGGSQDRDFPNLALTDAGTFLQG